MTSEDPWREWRLGDWNKRLFEHFFGVESGETGPVSRIVVTPEELLTVVGDAHATQSEVMEAFQRVIQERLAESRLLLTRDAKDLEWATPPSSIPAYFAHLVVTCIAASGTDSDEPTSEFRKRLNGFLGRGREYRHYDLKYLPQLWEMLRDWLEVAQSRGERYRRLLLTREDHLAIIGYSIALAFPALKDQERLARVLDGLVLPPPVGEVFQRIERERRLFSDRFQQAYASFRSEYFGRETGLYGRPFWSAVIDAIRRSPAGSRTKELEATRFLLRLDENFGSKYVLALLVDRSTRTTSRCRCRPLGEETGDGFEFLIDGSEGSGVDVGSLVLDTTISKDFPELARSELLRTVSGGLLLFTQDEDGIWLLSLSKPSGNRVHALIRSELASPFIHVMRRAGCALVPRQSRYAGWSEVGDFEATSLSKADFGATPFHGLRCLADVILPPRITLSDGVRLESAWLGRRIALPKISTETTGGTLTIQPVQTSHASSWVLNLEREGEESPCHRIPASAPLDSDLEGEYLIRARDERSVPPARVTFQKHALDTRYRACSDPTAWIAEGISSPTLGALDRSLTYGAEREGTFSDANLLLVERTSSVRDGLDDSDGVEALVDVLAAISVRRAGIGESDIYGWFTKALGIDRNLVWNTMRAWVESGLLDQLTYRRWRKRTYFAREPRLVGYRLTGGQFGATVSGLVPSGFARRIEEAGDSLGIEVYKVGPTDSLVPRPICLSADSPSKLLMLAEQLSLTPPRALAPLSDVISRIADILPIGESLPGGYEMERVIGTPTCHVEWHKRDDAPDFFVARSKNRTEFGTWSRNWAFLAAAEMQGLRPFERRTSISLARNDSFPAHLPVALGRWVTIASGLPPVPSEGPSGNVGYMYRFPNERFLREALDCMWPSAVPQELEYRARWIARLVAPSQTGAFLRPVVLPESIREALSACGELPGCGQLGSLRSAPLAVLPHIMALATDIANCSERWRGYSK